MPALTIILLFWTMVLTSVLALASDRHLRTIVVSHWKIIVVLFVATALWRIPADGVFFHGLEYEDSYVYTVAGRQIAEHVSPPRDTQESSFSISTCEVGSIKECLTWEPFPEHLLGYPYLIAEFSRVFGYTSSIGSLINLCASVLSVLFVFTITLAITDDSVAAVLAGFAFAAIPVFATYGLETSAEPFSNLCMILTLWFYLRLSDVDQGITLSKVSMWLAYSAALLFSQTVKREDVILGIVLPVMVSFVLARQRSTRSARIAFFAGVLLISMLGLVLSTTMHLLRTSEGERELLRQFPLTLGRLKDFITSFLSSFVVTRWYGWTFLPVIAGFVVALRKRSRAIVPVALLVAFVLIYATHVRSYYEMSSGRIAPEAALRFSMNFMGLWAIVGGIGLGSIVKTVSRLGVLAPYKSTLAWCTGAICVGILILSFIVTVRLRNNLVEDEMISRLVPALSAVRCAVSTSNSPAFIVTMEPLVVQMYADPKSRIVDLESVNSNMLAALVSSQSHVIFLREADRITDDDLKRYGDPIRYMLSLPSRTLVSNSRFDVVEIERHNYPEP